MRRLFTTQDKTIKNLIAHCHQTDNLTERLRLYLPPELAPHCRVASFEKGCLTISASSSSWATQFRYASAGNLLSELRTKEKLYHLRSIKCVVTPPGTFVPTQEVKTQRTLSHKSAEIIRESAKKIESEELRMALEKLARNVK
jgi:hypothetical protein